MSRRGMIVRALGAVAIAAVGIAVAFGVSAGVEDGTSSTPFGVAGCSPIGYQNGLASSELRMRRLDPGGFNATKTGAWDKFYATQRQLVAGHNATCSGPPPPPTTTAPPPTTTAPPAGVAPRTYNRASNGSDARFCIDGLPTNSSGQPFDSYSTYDTDGRSLGGRTRDTIVSGLRFADNMNGQSPCQGYTEAGRTFPPWPAASYER